MMETHPSVILSPLVVGRAQPSSSIGEMPVFAGLMWMKIGTNCEPLQCLRMRCCSVDIIAAIDLSLYRSH